MILQVAAPELFPTAIRATGHSIAGVMSEFGAFASPFVVSGSASKETIGIVFATFNFIAALCCVVLPETAGIFLCLDLLFNVFVVKHTTLKYRK